ncbi:ABC transporter ATPase [Mesonia sp.]|uniref:ABC transporter ATPase n=1 Tax=Mesonia sp. TaxID=1960830 RepID=UPI0017526702|nr:ABC transporter ATPase [Mesonia sp.]HIB38374.1 ABC transporter ATPase [Mesonia sp.]HIO27355.1 ABC transporter ATPase [Flavobacteriaceae bacterium]
MLIDFKDLPSEARIWIYQANRPFTEEELNEARPEIENFLTAWTAHGSSLKAGYQIPYNRFIVFGLDQEIAAASGCSIDASVHFIQSLEKKYNLNLLDKLNVTFKQGEFVAHKDLADFKKLVKNKSVSANTIVFNNLVNTKEEFTHDWEVPLKDSWHSRFL